MVQDGAVWIEELCILSMIVKKSEIGWMAMLPMSTTRSFFMQAYQCGMLILLQANGIQVPVYIFYALHYTQRV